MKLFKVKYETEAFVIWSPNKEELLTYLFNNKEYMVLEDDILYYEWWDTTMEAVHIQEMIPEKFGVPMKAEDY